MKEELLILTVLAFLGLVSDPATTSISAILLSVALAPTETFAEARGRDYSIRIKAKASFDVTAVQKGDTLYLLEKSIPLAPGEYTLVLSPAREAVLLGEQVYPAKLYTVKKGSKEFVLYVEFPTENPIKTTTI